MFIPLFLPSILADAGGKSNPLQEYKYEKV